MKTRRPPADPIDPQDLALFLDAVGEVAPVRADTADCRPPPPPPRPLRRMIDEAAVLDDMLSDAHDPDIEHGETLTWLRAGVQQTLLRKLRRGQFSIRGELDLHGMSSENARHALVIFLTEQRARGNRCVRIIHGKGYRSAQGTPVLKRLINIWLPQRDDVLAYCSARPEDGGTGAVYVLLRG